MEDSNWDGEEVRVMQGNEKGALWLCSFVLALLWMGVGLIEAC